MKPIDRLTVMIIIQGIRHEVGELSISGKRIFFKYYPSFLETGLLLSPFKLPLSDKVLEPDTNLFDGLFGVFHDSLPDGWGRLIIDRSLMAKGIPLSEVTPLDRLSFVSDHGHGALSYHPKADNPTMDTILLPLDDIAEEAQNVHAGMDSLQLDNLIGLGGSSGGARPKIFIGYNPSTDHLIPFTPNLPEGYAHWIIKFSMSSDPQDLAHIEYAYYHMAIEAGIAMSECRLFKSESGKYYFGTKRFDRIGNDRLHMHTAAGLMHDNFRLSNMDYGHLMDATFQLERHVHAYAKVLRLAAFNVFAHNRDDHSKNISYLMDSEGKWTLGPAYDLTFSYSSHGHHSTSVAGESKAPGIDHLIKLAKTFSFDRADEIIEQVRSAVGNWEKIARQHDVSKDTISRIKKVLYAVNNQ